MSGEYIKRSKLDSYKKWKQRGKGTPDLTDIYWVAINHYGEHAQLEKTLEELDEFKDEIKLYLAGTDNRKELISEMADVLNMIEQTMRIINTDFTEINAEMYSKMQRTIERIKEKSTVLSDK